MKKQYFQIYTACRRQTLSLFEEKAPRLTMVLAEIMALLPVLPLIYLMSVGSYVLTYYGDTPFGLPSAIAIDVLAVLLAVFLSCPMWQGVVYLGCRVASGETVTLRDIFYCFSSKKRFGRALYVTFDFLWRLLLPVGATTVFVWLERWVQMPWLTVLFCVVAWLVYLFLAPKRFGLLYDVLRDEQRSLKDIRQTQKATSDQSRVVGLLFWLYRLPGVLFGLVTVGVYFLLFALPEGTVLYALWRTSQR